ncbi:MAG: hypothetical protein EBZ48_03875 [Proteobacteria bacterium]|nr:hypothetical protein [Pseudomonadota bacterium]
MLNQSHCLFPFGYFWPALLAPFVLLGIPSAANILISALNLVLVFLIGKRSFGCVAALCAAVVYAFSPLAVLFAGEFLPSPATLCALLVCCYGLIRAAAEPGWSWRLAAGAAFCSAVAMRPYAALASLPTFFVLLRAGGASLGTARHLLIVALGALPIAILILIENRLQTGSLWLFPDSVYRNLSLGWGNLATGINHADSTWAFFVQMICSGPGVLLPLGFALYGVSAQLCWRTGVCAAAVIAFVVTHFFLPVHGLHAYGPRFYYEALAPLCLLIGVGVSECIKNLGGPNRKILGIFILVFFFFTNLIRLIYLLPRYQGYNGVL